MEILDRFPDTPAWLEGHRPEHLLVFTHIPKAAGTSFTGHLGKIYGRHLGLYYGEWATPIVGAPLNEMSEDFARDLYAFSSHQRYGVHRLMGRRNPAAQAEIGRKRLVCATLLRDPGERLHSEYHYVRSRRRNPQHSVVKELSFPEFLELRQKQWLNCMGLNQMCHMVSGMPHADFEAAKQALQANYTVAATIERSLEFVDELRRILGWPEDLAYERRNQTLGKPSLTDRERQEIADTGLIGEDQRLYDYLHQQGVFLGGKG